MERTYTIQDLLEKKVVNFPQSLKITDEESSYNSSNFLEQKELFDSLFKVESPSKPSYNSSKINDRIDLSYSLKEVGSDTVSLFTKWNNIENISARLINFYDDIVVLECLIDRDKKIYEEREFRASLFSDYDLQIGNLFFLRIFERKNELKLEIHNDPNLTFKEDFPTIDFIDLFKSSKLFNK